MVRMRQREALAHLQIKKHRALLDTTRSQKKRRGDLPSTSKATSLLISLLQPSRLWAKLISEVLAMVFLATDSGKEHRTAPENFCSSIRTVSVLILLIRGQFYLVHHLLMYYDSIGRDQLTFSLASARRAFGNKCQSC